MTFEEAQRVVRRVSAAGAFDEAVRAFCSIKIGDPTIKDADQRVANAIGEVLGIPLLAKYWWWDRDAVGRLVRDRICLTTTAAEAVEATP